MKEGDEVTQVYGETSSTRVTKILRTTLAVPHSVSELQYQGRKITVSSNHPFVTPDYQVVTAKTLKEGSMVLDGGGKAVQIEANTIREDFIGDLYNLIIHPESDRPIDHVVITNGIQSGDFLTQATLDSIQMDLDLREGKLIPIK